MPAPRRIKFVDQMDLMSDQTNLMEFQATVIGKHLMKQNWSNFLKLDQTNLIRLGAPLL